MPDSNLERTVQSTQVETEDVLSRSEQKTHSLFAGRVKVYPQKIKGTVRRWKWATLVVLLAIYYLAPWIRWDRGPDAPDQAILVDIPGRRLYFFFIEIWPQEVYFLTALLVLAALGLFLVTALFGRVWCGFTCPQTVWTDLFMWVERLIEGDRNQRMKLDRAPLSLEKVAKKGAKHAVWLVIALLTGGAWIMYFQDAPRFVVAFFTGQSGAGAYFFVGLFTATTYLLAGWAREQVCTYMCPWPRFQAALLDEDSLVVTYEGWRGEPRGKLKKNPDWSARGDCIECKKCVAVCPTGIDIRDGIQLECIGCGLCIDACNSVMEKIGRPRNLITWDSENNQKARAEGRPTRLRLLRARSLAYVAVLLVIVGITGVGLAGRSSLDVNVTHDRNPLFVTLSDGAIRNGYEVRILNKTREDRDYALTVEGLQDARFMAIGVTDDFVDQLVLAAPADGVAAYQVYVTVPRDRVTQQQTDVRFVIEDLASGETDGQNEVFRGP